MSCAAFLSLAEAGRREGGKVKVRGLAGERLGKELAGPGGEADSGALMAGGMPQPGGAIVVAYHRKVVRAVWAEAVVVADGLDVLKEGEQCDGVARQEPKGVGAHGAVETDAFAR